MAFVGHLNSTQGVPIENVIVVFFWTVEHWTSGTWFTVYTGWRSALPHCNKRLKQTNNTIPYDHLIHTVILFAWPEIQSYIGVARPSHTCTRSPLTTHCLLGRTIPKQSTPCTPLRPRRHRKRSKITGSVVRKLGRRGWLLNWLHVNDYPCVLFSCVPLKVHSWVLQFHLTYRSTRVTLEHW